MSQKLFSWDGACEVCGGVIRHETWCIDVNRNVLEAFRAVLNGVSEADEARLAGLGVKWERVERVERRK